jgi:hypothetical protein
MNTPAAAVALNQARAEELNRIHRELVVIIHDAETGSQLEALAGAVRDLTSVVAAFTSLPRSGP